MSKLPNPATDPQVLKTIEVLIEGLRSRSTDVGGKRLVPLADAEEAVRFVHRFLTA